ncbi:MAG: endopeptidase La [Deltaproteobacteria bacterium]|nr:endopeptidase La [Deltaproteobacteria bacterium]
MPRKGEGKDKNGGRDDDDNPELPKDLSVLPLRNSVFFPGGIIPIGVGRPKTIALLLDAERKNALIGIVAQRKPEIDDPKPGDLYNVGTAARILKLIKVGEDNYHLVVQGISRFRVRRFVHLDPFIKAEIEPFLEDRSADVEVEALALNLKKLARQVISLIPEIPQGASELVEGVSDPAHLCDLICANIDVPIEEKIGVLEEAVIKARLKKVLELLHRKREVLMLSNKIDTQVKGEMNKTQREYYLRQQLKAIKTELGELEGEEGELEELKKRLQSAKIPGEQEKAAMKEFNRLKSMQPASSEYTVSRTYLEWMADLPWAVSTEDKLDIDNARKVLDAKHYDLEKVKKRFIEFIAVHKLKQDMKGPILCLVGPPGVGKTSLGQSVAEALGRKFVRISLGGVHDEAEIRGHRRTYVGSLPGRIIQGLKKAGTNNPVFMLDEIDKIGHDFRGDPAAALLEVLDPEQNFSFSDHYLNVPFDLSQVLFITTANLAEPIPPALKDRMETIELPGYTQEEKVFIARNHLIQRQLKEHGLSDEHVEFDETAVDGIISSYTREAGVRNLERNIANVVRGVAVNVAGGKKEKSVVKNDDLVGYLGPEKFYSEIAERTEVPGVATGLAWTMHGGDILFIEATRMAGKGGLQLTGQLGDVMKESAHAAMSFIRTNARAFGIDENFLEKHDIHIHVPAGAIPKDGPSAGVTMFAALMSLLTGIRVRNDTAMTGEVTLRGNVLPVGGIKEKTLAARRAGIKRVILPERNRKDLIEIPEHAQKGMEFSFVTRMEEVLDAVLAEPAKIQRNLTQTSMGAAAVPPDTKA